MKDIKLFLSTLLVVSIFLSLGIAIIFASFQEKPAKPIKTFEIIPDKQVDPAIIAAENATEVYLPESFGYRVPAKRNPSHRGRLGDALSGGTNLIADEPVDPAIIAAEGAMEVFMTPITIGDNMYEYYDKNGVLFGTFIATSPATSQASLTVTPGAMVYSFDWKIAGNSHTHSIVEIDTTEAAADVYQTVLCLDSATTFAGYYDPAANEYRWLRPPFNHRLDGYFRLAASQKVKFALKNTSGMPGNYSGDYWLES